MNRLTTPLSLLLLLQGSVALAMPLPPAVRAQRARSSKDPIQVKVRRIEQMQQISTTAPLPRGALVGEHPVAVVLVQTADARFADVAATRASVTERFFSTEGPSLHTYYRENSHGHYRLVGEVFGPVDVPGALADYAYQAGSSSERVHRLVKRAFAASAAGLDEKRFDVFDRFGRPKRDGVIDHFAVIFPAAAKGSAGYFSPIWPHRGTIDTAAQGRKLKSYYVFSDSVPLGGIAHEHGHDIGLPDLYDRDDTSHGAGPWCLMASGSWLGDGARPGHIGAWGKIKMGWVRPQIIARPHSRIEIAAAATTPTILKVPIGRADSPEYFLVENRQRIGFDEKLPSEGLLIWHIDEASKSNDDERRKLVDVEEPSKTQDLDFMVRDRAPDLIDTYRAGLRTRFDDTTDPGARKNDGDPTGIIIDDISASKGVMTARFDVPVITVPQGEPYDLVRDNYNFGAFGYVPLPAGSEELVPFSATRGGYEIHGFEALLIARPRTQARVHLTVYANANGAPGRVLYESAQGVQFGADSYQWMKVRLPENPVRLKSEQRFWVGLRHASDQVGLAYNPDSVSNEPGFRLPGEQGLRTQFNFASGPKPVPDYIVRTVGYGFIGVKNPDAPEQADESDELIKRMREADGMLDAGKWMEAKAQYETVLAAMEERSARFATWIPVVINALGVAAYQAKDYTAALDYFQRSLRKAQQAEDVRAQADILENLGETAFFAGEMDLAAGYCGRSRALNAERPARRVENEYWLGRIALASGDAHRAGSHLDAAAHLVDEVHRSDEPERARWLARIERARTGEAVGEDWGDGTSRLVAEREEQRELEEAEEVEETSSSGSVWRIDLADFGLEGAAVVQE